MNKENNYAIIYKNSTESILNALCTFLYNVYTCNVNPTPGQPHSHPTGESGS